MKTTVKINKTFNGEGNLKGLASVNFDDCFAMTGIRILDSQKGLFVSMPNRKIGEKDYKDICFPVTKEYREELNDAVLAAYHQKLEESQDHENKDEHKKNRRGHTSQSSDSEQGADPSSEEEQGDAQEGVEEFEESEGMNMNM